MRVKLTEIYGDEVMITFHVPQHEITDETAEWDTKPGDPDTETFTPTSDEQINAMSQAEILQAAVDYVIRKLSSPHKLKI